jgi:vacuolar-type H+-ATPase subunit I/STV1
MNPFELRFSIFNSAKDLLVKQHEAQLAAWEALDKTSKKAQDLAPKFPTIEEIVDKAIEINKFISESSVNEFTKVAKRLTGTTVIF